MRFLILICILSLITHLSYGQGRDTLHIEKLSINSGITIDNVNNLSGGIKKGSGSLALFDLSVDYDFHKGVLKNTGFSFHMLKTAGKSPSENYTGDIQILSNIDGKADHFFYELLLRQTIQNFNISIGMHDLNSEFMTSELAGDFINSSFGISPAISLNIPVSIFPATTFGGLVSWHIKKVNILGGIYNLNYRYMEEAFHPNNHFFQDGYLGITEIQYEFFADHKLKGTYKAGFYTATCRHQHSEQIPETCVSETNHGYYLIADQDLIRFSSGASTGLFLQAGIAPDKINLASEYYGGGISCRSLTKCYLPDQFGIALGCVKLNELINNSYKNVNKFETVIEVTASIECFKHVFFQPDIQYILNPSGIYKNAFTATARLKIELNS